MQEAGMGQVGVVLLIIFLVSTCRSADDDDGLSEGFCNLGDPSCADKYTRNLQSEPAKDSRWDKYLRLIDAAVEAYRPCEVTENCSSCHLDVIKADLAPFNHGITKQMLDEVASKGTVYQIIGHKVYRQKECMFPGRCAGIEHFLKKVAKKVADVELVVNTRDWPQLSKHFSSTPLPVFSFSKTKDYWDLEYPAWAFWEGGPAIGLYPRGLGKWGEHRRSLQRAAEQWPWDKKHKRAFFRGSRTSAERDPLILLSRARPELVDARYTKNQAWKSPSDTLMAEPAEEVSLEEHCKFRFLFNFRGVAASFRFKHLFLCGSLVFHVGHEWTEFFYHQMQPWVHYIPVESSASQDQIRELIEFAMENDDVVWEIAERGRYFVESHLRVKDVSCYWSHLLRSYSKLIRYKPQLNPDLILIA
ncbi:O-glucosyltransferase rumi homolog [Neocloeon triangulifer]|uniref:O-glucosyltransferase rumi homolog n=1 Tax=Neocloeon triangulifer TaxID=2078957 RepID=UPI00286EC264|nr:O-glucosyltransferase rumi homolog [Neocloeon triangulifer]